MQSLKQNRNRDPYVHLRGIANLSGHRRHSQKVKHVLPKKGTIGMIIHVLGVLKQI